MARRFPPRTSLRGMKRLPKSRIAKAIHAVAAKISVMGNMVLESKMPMLAEARPEMPICKKPSIAYALAMFRLNGTSASAAAFGYASLRLDSAMKSDTNIAGNAALSTCSWFG